MKTDWTKKAQDDLIEREAKRATPLIEVKPTNFKSTLARLKPQETQVDKIARLIKVLGHMENECDRFLKHEEEFRHPIYSATNPVKPNPSMGEAMHQEALAKADHYLGLLETILSLVRRADVDDPLIVIPEFIRNRYHANKRREQKTAAKAAVKLEKDKVKKAAGENKAAYKRGRKAD